MIIPIKCVTCGTVLADKYRYYQEQVRKEKMKNNMDVNKVIYYTKSSKTTEKSPEGKTLDTLGLKNMCCRRVMLTHVDVE
jgi:DNA-directed RNA polymerase I, II, and III subunit RPABC5|tara:strand:+ start:727 stop:966 length:240 start_codon:yes stop_codon:yes gene_type:complete